MENGLVQLIRMEKSARQMWVNTWDEERVDELSFVNLKLWSPVSVIGVAGPARSVGSSTGIQEVAS